MTDPLEFQTLIFLYLILLVPPPAELDYLASLQANTDIDDDYQFLLSSDGPAVTTRSPPPPVIGQPSATNVPVVNFGGIGVPPAVPSAFRPIARTPSATRTRSSPLHTNTTPPLPLTPPPPPPPRRGPRAGWQAGGAGPKAPPKGPPHHNHIHSHNLNI